jgi:hypothetical protein
MGGFEYPIPRTTYLIDPSGKVAKRWDKVKVPHHAQDVLGAIGGNLLSRARIKPEAASPRIQQGMWEVSP